MCVFQDQAVLKNPLRFIQLLRHQRSFKSMHYPDRHQHRFELTGANDLSEVHNGGTSIHRFKCPYQWARVVSVLRVTNFLEKWIDRDGVSQRFKPNRCSILQSMVACRSKQMNEVWHCSLIAEISQHTSGGGDLLTVLR